MADIDVNAALGSLDFSEGSSPAADPPASTEPQTAAAPQSTEQASGTTESSDSFTKLDPTSLAPELQEFYKSMQADYTRKMQDTAPLRTALEQLGEGVDIERVTKAYQFADALDSDPDYQRQVYDYLAQQLGVANAQAAPQPEAAEWEGFMDEGDESQGGELPAQLQSALQEMRTEFQQFQQERNALKEERELTALATRMQGEEMAIRQANPQYKEEHIQKIYRLAAVNQGSLSQAQQEFEQMRSMFAAETISQKENVPDTRGPGQITSGEAIPKFKNMDEAHDAALAHFLAAQADNR